jgi:hypothetical protein
MEGRGGGEAQRVADQKNTKNSIARHMFDCDTCIVCNILAKYRNTALHKRNFSKESIAIRILILILFKILFRCTKLTFMFLKLIQVIFCMEFTRKEPTI